MHPGEVTEVVRIGDETPEGPIHGNSREGAHLFFADEMHGWYVGFTGDWRRRHDPITLRLVGEPLAGNFLCSTRDGGQSWKCQVHVYRTIHIGHSHLNLALRAPKDLDFVNPKVGWVAPNAGWIYHTADSGTTWELVRNPLGGDKPEDNRGRYISQIDFVDESRGWAVARHGVWFTPDGGQTWQHKLSGWFDAVFADDNGVWASGSRTTPTKQHQQGIFHSADNGETWQLEWQGNVLSYIGYHPVTQSLWAGGVNGIILKRTISTTAVTPGGKLTTLWGKLKADPNID